MLSLTVRVLGPADTTAATSILVRAFDREPAKLTMLSDPTVRRSLLEVFVKARLYDTLRYGTAHGAEVDGELGAIAVWYPPGVPKLSAGGAMRLALGLFRNVASVARSFPRIIRILLSDVRGAAALVKQRRPAVARATQGRTWCLDVLGTAPEHRGKGLARALLERQLQRCDQDGAAVWLEATDPVNPPIYERFGFETIAHIDGSTWLPGYWIMRREPRPV